MYGQVKEIAYKAVDMRPPSLCTNAYNCIHKYNKKHITYIRK